MKTPEEYAAEIVQCDGRSYTNFLLHGIVAAALEVLTNDDGSKVLEEVRKCVATIVQQAREELYVHALSDPPVSSVRLEAIKETISYAGLYNDKRDLLLVIEWLQSQVAHMAKDNGFDEGYEAGLKAGKSEYAASRDKRVRE